MITAENVLDPNKATRNESLYTKFGMDPNGNNEIGAWVRRLAQVSGEQAAQGLTFRNSLEPERQGAIRAGITAANPANMVESAKARGEDYQRQGTEGGMRTAQALTMGGYGEGAAAGALAAGANAGTKAANAELFRAYSPEEQQKAYATILNYVAQATGMGLEELLKMFGLIETRSRQNQTDKQAGGLSGIFQDLAPLLQGMSLPGLPMAKPGGFGVGSTNNPSWLGMGNEGETYMSDGSIRLS